jgi:glycosyltransferase involved in cell wall biosynthesis
MANPRLCLSMIVKNESKIIRRLLESVAPILDMYCICDTGSTDNTVNLIESFFKNKNIPGKVVHEPFQNFEYNRSFALKACDDLDADYILLMDADMILWMNDKITPEKFKKLLSSHDCFFMFQGNESMYYKNTRIVKNHAGFSYKGVTHEYVDLPPNATQGILVKDLVFIKDIGDGGAKADKFVRDVRLLKEGLRKDPKNERYMFYLANSLKDLASTQTYQFNNQVSQIQEQCKEMTKQFDGQSTVLGLVSNIEELQNNLKKEQETLREKYLEESIDWYKKRIVAGGFWEEVWYSHYNIGHAYFHLGEAEKALYYFHKAYVLHPERVENIYEIVKYYREHGQNDLAVYYYMLGRQSMEKYKSRDYLFIQKDVYDFKLDYEMSIIGYYTNPSNIDMRKLCMQVLGQPRSIDEGMARNVLSNYKFYTERLRDIDTESWKKGEWGTQLASLGKSLEIPEEFHSSTPSFCFNKNNANDVYGLVRYVNYKVNDEGGYEQRDTIQTINVMGQMSQNDNKFVLKNEKVMEYDKSHDNLYVGLEDVRLYYHNDDKIYYTGNRGLGYGKMVIEHGWVDKTDFKTHDSRFLKIQGQSSIEKNWVMFEYPEDREPIYMVYNWYPMTIGKIVEDEFQIIKRVQTPYLFKFLRGSTNGVLVGDEIWFLCHVVSYEDRRYYYHIMVMLDKTTLTLKRTSKMFTFEREKVEYCLGMDVIEEEVYFGISIMDRETKYLSVPKKWF